MKLELIGEPWIVLLSPNKGASTEPSIKPGLLVLITPFSQLMHSLRICNYPWTLGGHISFLKKKFLFSFSFFFCMFKGICHKVYS